MATNLNLNSKYAQIISGSYTGTGTYGSSNKNSLTFDFYPQFVWISKKDNTSPYFDSDYINYYAGQNSTTGSTQLYTEAKTLYWCNVSADSQLNVSGITYVYVAIGTNVLTSYEKLITSSGTVTLPVNGNYYLELHGAGGGASYDSPYGDMYSAGGSGQVYNSIALSAGDYSVVIGQINNWGNGGSTSFGSYSVAGGNARTSSAQVSGVGNVGGGSVAFSTTQNIPVKNGGGLYPYYGSGGCLSSQYSVSLQNTLTGGAVYVKLLSVS